MNISFHDEGVAATTQFAGIADDLVATVNYDLINFIKDGGCEKPDVVFNRQQGIARSLSEQGMAWHQAQGDMVISDFGQSVIVLAANQT